MAKISVEECLGIILSLMERRIKQLQALETATPQDWDSIKRIEAEYWALAEVEDSITAIMNAPVTHQDAPGSMQ